MQQFIRVLEWFNKSGCDLIVGEEDISFLNHEKLQTLLNMKGDEDDPMLFGCYKINDYDIKSLQSYIKHKINIKKYKYFIATYQK